MSGHEILPRWSLPVVSGDGGEPSFEVLPEILAILQTDREPHCPGPDSAVLSLGGGEVGVGGGGGVTDQGAGITDVHGDGPQLEGVAERSGGLLSPGSSRENTPDVPRE